MNWDAIGAIGQVLGSVAVFITLGYLALQMRQNTQALHSNASDQAMGQASAFRRTIMANPDLARILVEASSNPAGMNPSDLFRARMATQEELFLAYNMWWRQELGLTQSGEEADGMQRASIAMAVTNPLGRE